jgi:hypothetical protein
MTCSGRLVGIVRCGLMTRSLVSLDLFTSSGEWETVRPLERANLNHWTTGSVIQLEQARVSHSPEDGNRSSSRNVLFLVFKISDD